MGALFDPEHLRVLLTMFGYMGVFGIVFAESGLFFGFFLPGDSLLVTAGILAASGVFHIGILLVLVVVAAILGDSVGYMFGKFVGRKLFTKESSLLWKPSHLAKAESFYVCHGKKAIVLARFIPVVRTFVPIVAGAAHMQYDIFIRYNVLGGLLWGAGVTSFGYFVGTKIPNIDHYLFPIIIGIIILSVLPVCVEMYKQR